jgi:hypothetical protein
MLLSTISFVLSVFLLAQQTLAVLTVQQVVGNIALVTTASQDANSALSMLSTNTNPIEIGSIGQVGRFSLHNSGRNDDNAYYQLSLSSRRWLLTSTQSSEVSVVILSQCKLRLLFWTM